MLLIGHGMLLSLPNGAIGHVLQVTTKLTKGKGHILV